MEPAVVLCVGPELWQQARVIEQLKGLCLTAGFEETDFARLPAPPAEGPQALEQVRAILEAVSTSPFGSVRRLVAVGPWDEIGPRRAPWLTGYLEKPNPRSCLVLCADRFEEASNRLPNAWNRPGIVRVVSCQSPEPRRWLAQRARELGKRLPPQAADLLVRRIGSDLSSLERALESLSLLAGSAAAITPADVQALISPSLQETAFEILDSAGTGQTAKAVEALHQALELGKIPLDKFLGAFGWYVRMAWDVRRGTKLHPAASTLRRQAMARLSRWSDQRLRRLLEETLQADLGLKLGHPVPEMLADRLLVTLAS